MAWLAGCTWRSAWRGLRRKEYGRSECGLENIAYPTRVSVVNGGVVVIVLDVTMLDFIVRNVRKNAPSPPKGRGVNVAVKSIVASHIAGRVSSMGRRKIYRRMKELVIGLLVFCLSFYVLAVIALAVGASEIIAGAGAGIFAGKIHDWVIGKLNHQSL